MSRRTLGVRINERFDEYDEIARRVIEEVGGTYQGTSVGSGMRNYYFEANDDQMARIVDALREAGAQIERSE